MDIKYSKLPIFKIIVASTICFATSANAQTMQQALQDQITRKMAMMPPVTFGRLSDDGIARVAFEVGPDGKTHFVKIAKRSGSSAVDRAAVRLIASFHDLPPGVSGKPLYAVLQYGTDSQQENQVTKEALAVQVASAKTDAAAIRLASTPSSGDVKIAAAAAPVIAYATRPAFPK